MLPFPVPSPPRPRPRPVVSSEKRRGGRDARDGESGDSASGRPGMKTFQSGDVARAWARDSPSGVLWIPVRGDEDSTADETPVRTYENFREQRLGEVAGAAGAAPILDALVQSPIHEDWDKLRDHGTEGNMQALRIQLEVQRQTSAKLAKMCKENKEDYEACVQRMAEEAETMKLRILALERRRSKSPERLQSISPGKRQGVSSREARGSAEGMPGKDKNGYASIYGPTVTSDHKGREISSRQDRDMMKKEEYLQFLENDKERLKLKVEELTTKLSKANVKVAKSETLLEAARSDRSAELHTLRKAEADLQHRLQDKDILVKALRAESEARIQGVDEIREKYVELERKNALMEQDYEQLKLKATQRELYEEDLKAKILDLQQTKDSLEQEAARTIQELEHRNATLQSHLQEAESRVNEVKALLPTETKQDEDLVHENRLLTNSLTAITAQYEELEREINKRHSKLKEEERREQQKLQQLQTESRNKIQLVETELHSKELELKRTKTLLEAEIETLKTKNSELEQRKWSEDADFSALKRTKTLLEAEIETLKTKNSELEQRKWSEDADFSALKRTKTLLEAEIETLKTKNSELEQRKWSEDADFSALKRTKTLLEAEIETLKTKNSELEQRKWSEDADFSALKRTKTLLEAEIETLKTKNSELEQRKWSEDADFSALKRTKTLLEAEIETLKTKNSELEQRKWSEDADFSRAAHAAELALVHERHKSELADRDREHKFELAEKEREHKVENAERERRHRTEVEERNKERERSRAKDNEQHRQQLYKMKEECRQISEEYDGLQRKTHAALEDATKKVHDENEKLTRKLHVAQDQVANAQRLLANAQSDKDLISREYEEQSTKLAELSDVHQKHGRELSKQIAERDMRIYELEKTIKRLDDALEETEQKVIWVSAESEANSIRSAQIVEDLKATLASSEEKKRFSERACEDTMQKLKQLEAKLRLSDSQRAQLESSVVQMTATISALSGKIEELEKLQKTEAQRASMLDVKLSLETDARMWAEEIALKAVRSKESSDWEKTHEYDLIGDNIESEKASLREMVVNLESQLAQKRAISEMDSSLKAEILRLEQQLAGYQEKEKHWEVTRQQLCARNAQLEGKQTVFPVQQHDIVQTRKLEILATQRAEDIKVLRRQVLNLQGEAAKLEDECLNLRKRLEKTEAELHEARRESDMSKEYHAREKAQFQRCQAEMQIAESRIAHMMRTQEGIQKEKELLEKANAKLSDQLSVRMGQAAITSQEVEFLGQQAGAFDANVVHEASVSRTSFHEAPDSELPSFRGVSPASAYQAHASPIGNELSHMSENLSADWERGTAEAVGVQHEVRALSHLVQQLVEENRGNGGPVEGQDVVRESAHQSGRLERSAPGARFGQGSGHAFTPSNLSSDRRGSM